MLRTPLKNSKSVNKPFKSPFDSSSSNKDKIKSVKENTKQNCASPSSPLSTRNKEAKRILVLDENEKEVKRRKIAEESNDENTSKETSHYTSKDLPENLTKTDLLLLKRKVFELRQEIDCLKSRERCTKKHNPEELKASIHSWKSACQNALETIRSELTERNGQSSKISDILKMLNIPETIVGYSEADDGFV